MNLLTPRKTLLALALLGLAAGPSSPARAEVVTLADGTRIHGKLVHYFDGEVTLETAGGVRVKLPTEKIKSIRFKLPRPRKAFSTPQKTFNRWKHTLLKRKLKDHIDCYALMYQMLMTNMMGAMTRTEFEKMVKGHRQTRYVVKGTRYKGKNMAFLKVAARLPGAKGPRAGELLFVRENGEWKMVPPQYQQPQTGP